MKKIAIIGNAGGGKSALARKLSAKLEFPLYEIDQLQWSPGWTRTDLDEVASVHTQWLAEPQWIIDGWGSWEILAQRFEIADTIIMVDMPIAAHYWWALKRQVKASFHLDPHWPPPGCEAFPVTWRLLKLMWHIHKNIRPQLIDWVSKHAASKRVIFLRSFREVQGFLEE
ncbi:MAG: flagellar protein FlaR [Anaerolineales bacterium]|nr:flagellar protein FlaR [Chloroflexota bacterium]MBL6983953.1 flagellar protein FlaR [Anaerolineales bacterium]